MNTATPAAAKASVVLAHGAWADGSSWSRVITRLRGQGVKTYAAALPLTSLSDDIAALDRILGRIEGPTVLVGHAYAGAVIGSASAGQVSGLVYIAALAPDEGETVGDVFYRGEPHPSAPELTPDSHGFVWLPEDAFSEAFAQNASAEDHTVLSSVQRPIAVESITTAVGRPLWKDLPSWYFIAEHDRMIPPATQRFMAERMGADIRSMPTDHTPLVTASDLVADLVLEAVKAAGDSGPRGAGAEAV